MRNFPLLVGVFVYLSAALVSAEPIRLHPDNPHYFEYKGKPLALVTSAEHYGAVINLDFDYAKYLDTLAADGLNYTRIFTGAYIEPAGAFGIRHNTLAPGEGRAITPWARSETPGYANGGAKFDLSRWDSGYFARLKDFVSHAAGRGVIVEVTLFCSMYNERNWQMSPLHPDNNTGDLQIEDYRKIQTDQNGPFMDIQTAMVKKIVRELNEYDNLFFEIQNEPWGDQAIRTRFANTRVTRGRNQWLTRTGPVSEASERWQAVIADTIYQTEQGLRKKHLIAHNFGNQGHPIARVNPQISVLNFHYAWPDAARWNYGWDRVIGFDESGFAGSDDAVYRVQAWRFMLSGGGLFNNLDYSFFVGHEDGLGQNEAGGGGSAALRKQLGVLTEFLHSFNFIQMKPDDDAVHLAPGCVTHTLAEPGRQYGIYIEGPAPVEISLELPAGHYRAEWVSVLGDDLPKPAPFHHAGGTAKLTSPEFERDIALKVVAVDVSP